MYWEFKIQLEFRDGSRDEFTVSTYQTKMVESLPEMLLRGSSAVRCIVLDMDDNVFSKWAWKDSDKRHIICLHNKKR